MLRPQYISNLEKFYGPPSQARFGSAVFYERVPLDLDLEQIALQYYRYFMGDLWERFGETAWMDPWKQVYARLGGKKADIVAEMGAIANPEAALSVPLVLEPNGDGESAQKALSAVYDDVTVTDLRIYTLGDGAALSGLLIAGRWETGDTAVLVFLSD